MIKQFLMMIKGDDAIGTDQFLMLSNSETTTSHSLADGRYRLRLLGSEGAPLTEHEFSMTAAMPGTPQTMAHP